MNFFGNKRKRNEEFSNVESGRVLETTPVLAEINTSNAEPHLDSKGQRKMASIGKSITIKGDLTGEEDLVVEGTVDGKIDFPENELTIGESGTVNAEVHAQSIVVVGSITGNVSATEKLEIQSTGLIEGDVRAPRLVIHEGARLNGSVEMSEDSPRPATTHLSFSEED